MRNTLIFLTLMLCVACTSPQIDHITILSTADTHSQVEPTPIDANKDANMGGYARRLGMIKQEREADPNLLLFDSGDFSQGTPYFNFYHGRVEVDALNQMGYDAVTLGNHEFDNGIDSLAKVLSEARFAVVVANYDVRGTALEGIVKPYVVINRSGLRIGVFGLGVSPDDLISKANFTGITYLDPLSTINETAQLLREKEDCDLVICLSHLGSDVPGKKGHEGEYDLNLIPHTRGVDVFLSGHSHHIQDLRVADADGHEVVLRQTNKAGVTVCKTVLQLSHD